MKIIDLLNKIANGEEVPKKIKYNTFELKRTKSNNLLRLYVDEEGMFFPEYYSGLTLNDEVEIIEEEKKIEKITMTIYTNKDIRYISIPKVKKDIEDKINEILDYIKNEGE